MIYLITKSGNLSFQKTLFFFKVHNFQFTFCDFIKMSKNSRYLTSSTQNIQKKFLIEVEITLKCNSSYYNSLLEDLMCQQLFYSLYSKHLQSSYEESLECEETPVPLFSNQNSQKKNLEIVFLFQISEWTSRFVTYRIILTLRDLQSNFNKTFSLFKT